MHAPLVQIMLLGMRERNCNESSISHMEQSYLPGISWVQMFWYAERNPNSFHGNDITGSVREEKGNGNTDEYKGKGKTRR